MKKSLFLTVLVVLSFLACKNVKETDVKNRFKTSTIVSINGYPEGFTGCGCAFAKNEAEYYSQKFIYLEKYGATDESLNLKYINIDGKLIKWSTIPPKDFKVELNYKNTTTSKTDQEPKSGNLKLIFKDNSVLETEFYGFCGC